MNKLYFDQYGFLTDEANSVGFTDEPLPKTDPGILWNWNGFNWVELPRDYTVKIPTGSGNPITSTVLPFNQQRENALIKIDADSDVIYQTVVGNRLSEYSAAEADAIAFKAAGYEGPVPIGVQSWALAKNKSNQWAADDILQQSSDWRAAQGAIRTHRLSKKELVRNAEDEVELTKILKEWNQFIMVIRNALKLPTA